MNLFEPASRPAGQPANSKAKLRAVLRENRNNRNYDPNLATELNIFLAEICLLIGARRITCYLPTKDEPDVELFIDWAIENQIEVLVPRAKDNAYLEWVVFDGNTKIGKFGIAEGTGEIRSAQDIDLAIIPALAISQDGVRLGKGMGYYDRALPTFKPVPPVVAVVFKDELISSIPGENHDHPVDAVVTPSGITYFTGRLK